MPSSLLLIEEEAFVNCSSLESVEYSGIHDPMASPSVYYFSDNYLPFDGCSNLDHVRVFTNFSDDTFCGIDVIRYAYVSSTGEVDGRWVVLKDTAFTDIEELKQYFESDRYIVGDLDSNDIVDSSMVVTRDVSLVVRIKNEVVVIEFENPVMTEVTMSDVALLISEATGIDMEELILDVVSNEQGQILRIVVYINDSDKANSIKTMIDNIDRTEGHCTAGILCRSKPMRVTKSESIFLNVANQVKTQQQLIGLTFILSIVIFITILS